MCGIVAYVGPRNAADIVIAGLHRLEYRGYDSAGLAIRSADGEQLETIKTAGKIGNLEQALAKAFAEREAGTSNIGIGHTRWATHGAPSTENAHPHVSRNGDFAIVHNGIVENYAVLKQRLIDKGYSFASSTDSEVIAHLIEEHYEGDFRAAVAAALGQLEGTYGIAVLSRSHPDTVVAARKGSPIAIGVSRDETIVASDVSAIVNYTKQVIFLNDGDIATATAGNVDITSVKNVPVSPELTHIDESGRPRMVDVSGKPDTQREAVAKCLVRMAAPTFERLREGKLPKGEVLTVAQLAGIMAAKQTPQLIPLCHPILIGEVRVEFSLNELDSTVEIMAAVKSSGKTGVEMEALTAVTVAALTIYDMCKAVDRGIRIESVRLVRKSGGKSGTIALE